jgi:hypothetical protein
VLRHCYFKQWKSETTTTTFVYPVFVSPEMREKNYRNNVTCFSLLKKLCIAVQCACLCAHALAEESDSPPINSGQPVKSNFTLCLETYSIKIYVWQKLKLPNCLLLFSAKLLGSLCPFTPISSRIEKQHACVYVGMLWGLTDVAGGIFTLQQVSNDVSNRNYGIVDRTFVNVEWPIIRRNFKT